MDFLNAETARIISDSANRMPRELALIKQDIEKAAINGEYRIFETFRKDDNEDMITFKRRIKFGVEQRLINLDYSVKVSANFEEGVVDFEIKW